MKSILCGSLSALVLGLNLSVDIKAEASELTPFNLVQLAHQGYFKEHNIPSYGKLNSAIKSRRIKAEDVVEAAIAEGRLASETLKDKGYLKTVDFKLNRLHGR